MSIDSDGFYGIYRGVVYSNKDPLGQGRLRLKVPQLFADQITGWAWSMLPASADFELPAVGQGVWVMFEGGNIAYPVWVGVFGKEASQNYRLQIDRLDPSKNSQAIQSLIALSDINNGQKEFDLTQTVLNIAEKLMERNYGSFYDTTIQTQTAINTPKAISLDTIDFASNVRIVNGTRITIDKVGAYNLQWSGQFMNTDSSDHDVRVWLRYNGQDYPQSASIVSVPSKHGSVNGHLVAAWNWLGKSQTPGDYVELMWSTDSTSVTLQSYPAGAGGPAVPSVIVTLTECE